jgi:hypothetical protein
MFLMSSRALRMPQLSAPVSKRFDVSQNLHSCQLCFALHLSVAVTHRCPFCSGLPVLCDQQSVRNIALMNLLLENLPQVRFCAFRIQPFEAGVA